MAKVKTLKKQDFSLEKMQKIKLKKGAKVSRNQSVKRMKDPKFILPALLECLAEDDLDSFREILQAHLEIINITEFAKDAKVSRKTIYNMLEPGSNPTLKNVTKVLRSISA